MSVTMFSRYRILNLYVFLPCYCPGKSGSMMTLTCLLFQTDLVTFVTNFQRIHWHLFFKYQDACIFKGVADDPSTIADDCALGGIKRKK